MKNLTQELKSQLKLFCPNILEQDNNGNYRFPYTLHKRASNLISNKKIQLDIANEEQKGVLIPEIAALTELLRLEEIQTLKEQIEILQKKLEEATNG